MVDGLTCTHCHVFSERIYTMSPADHNTEEIRFSFHNPNRDMNAFLLVGFLAIILYYPLLIFCVGLSLPSPWGFNQFYLNATLKKHRP